MAAGPVNYDSKEEEDESLSDEADYTPIGIIHPTLPTGRTRCLAYEVYQGNEILGISFVSLDKKWIKPSFGLPNMWHKVEDREGKLHIMSPDYPDASLAVMHSKAVAMLESYVVETELLGCDLKLD